jgi:hypothetical protein
MLTWLNPWAWLGIATLAVPVLVHLLERNRARVRRIATLRFLEATPPASTRPTRITDPLLLLVRLLILAVAVTALARPTATANPASALGQEPPLTRVILVDAGPAMLRDTPGGGSALEVARRRALGEIASSTSPDPEAGWGERGGGGPARPGGTYVVEVPGSGAGLGAAASGAAAFLEHVPGRREILVHSVLGAGALPSELEGGRLRGIPVRLEQIPLAPPVPDTRVVRHLASETRISVLSAEGGVQVGWERPDPPPGAADSLLQAGPAYLAAEISRSPAPDPGFPATLAMGPGATSNQMVSAGWGGTPERVGDLVLALSRDAGLGAAARDAGADAGTWPGGQEGGATAPATVAIRSMTGAPAVLARPAQVEGEPGVLIASVTGPDTFLSFALVGAVGRAAREDAALRELDPRIHSAEEVRGWNDRFGNGDAQAGVRPGTAGDGQDERDPAEGTGESRILWGLVLLLLTAEWRLRLRRGAGR